MTGLPSRQQAPAKLALGVIGLGYWGPNILRVLSEREDVEVSWICDLDRDRLARSARRHPRARPTTEAADLLTDNGLDAILIATPVFTHYELASQSLAAGKHTFVEKPLAGSASEAVGLIRLADRDGLVLMGGHTFVYSPPVRKVKELLERGELGDVHFITSARVNLGLHQSDVSVVWDLGPHDFSILRFWLEEAPDSISAIGHDAIVTGLPDVAFITAQYPSGALANLELSWLAPSKLRRTVLVGSEKMVVYEDGGAEPVRIFDHGVVYKDPDTFGEYQLSYRSGDILAPRVDTSEPLAIELEEFIKSIRSGSPPRGNAELCLDVIRMIEAAEASMVDGGAPVPVEVRGEVAR